MIKWILLALIGLSRLLSGSALHAQELVTNGGFESFSQLPTSGSQVDRLNNWNPLIFSPDYVNGTFRGVIWGRQDIGAFEGSGFVGLYSLFASNRPTSGWSEAIYQELEVAPLIAGESYRISVSTMQATNSADRNCGPVSLYGFENEPTAIGRGLPDTLPGAVLLWRGAVNELSDWRVESGAFTSPQNLNFIAVAFGWQFGCSQYGFIDELSIELDTPTFSGLPTDLALCDSAAVLLTLDNPGAAYTWQDGSTDSTFLATASGTYSVVIELDGKTFRDSVTIDLQTSPILTLPADTILCGATELRVDAGLVADSYRWSTGDVGREAIIRGDSEVSLEAVVGACTVRDTFLVAFRQNPAPNLGPDRSACEGDTIVLSTSFPGAAVRWSDSSFGERLQVLESGTYGVTITDGSCSGNDSVALTFQPLPTLMLPPDTVLCGTNELRVDAGLVADSYRWSTGDVGREAIIRGDSEVSLEAVVSACTVRDTFLVAFRQNLEPNLGQDRNTCAGDTIVLTTNFSGATVSWNDGSFGESLAITQSGRYAVEVTEGNCTGRDTIEINFFDNPVINLGNDLSFCTTDTITLIPERTEPNTTYSWAVNTSGLPFLDIIVLQNTSEQPLTTSFTLRGEREGCITEDTITITAQRSVIVELPQDTTLCEGDSLQVDLDLVTQNVESIRWNFGSVSEEVNLTQAGVYRVEVESIDGCVTSDQFEVLNEFLPTLSLESERVACAGDTILLGEAVSVASGISFNWDDGVSTAQREVTQPGTYVLTVSSARCAATDTTIVAFNAPPEVDLGPDTTLCQGDELILFTPIDADQVSWQDGSDAPEYVIRNGGTYTAEVARGACVVTSSITINQPELPKTGELLGLPRTLCRGSEALLDATWTNAIFLWSTGEANPRISVDTPGFYSVTLSIDGCQSQETVEVLPPNSGACPGCKAFLPNAFSPNGDANNDQLTIYFEDACEVASYRMQVFDRWGNLLFTSTDLRQPWDGTIQGQEVDIGVYTVVVELRFLEEANGRVIKEGVALMR